MNNNMNAQQIVQEQINRRGSVENPSSNKNPVKKIRIEEVMMSRGIKEISDQHYMTAFQQGKKTPN